MGYIEIRTKYLEYNKNNRSESIADNIVAAFDADGNPLSVAVYWDSEKDITFVIRPTPSYPIYWALKGMPIIKADGGTSYVIPNPDEKRLLAVNPQGTRLNLYHNYDESELDGAILKDTNGDLGGTFLDYDTTRTPVYRSNYDYTPTGLPLTNPLTLRLADGTETTADY